VDGCISLPPVAIRKQEFPNLLLIGSAIVSKINDINKFPEMTYIAIFMT